MVPSAVPVHIALAKFQADPADRNPYGIAPFNGGFGHAKHHAGFLALRDGYPRPTSSLPGRCSVFAHARHQHAHGLLAEFLGHAVEQDIDRWAMSIHRRVIAEHNNIAERQLLTFMCRFPGQISARPASSKSPDWASLTRMGQISSSRLAKSSVNPSGMCCTTRMLPEKSSGSCGSRYCRALGPPVETPMATICVGAMGRSFGGSSPSCASPGRNCVCTPALCAAALIFLISSRRSRACWPQHPAAWRRNQTRPAPAP